MSMTEDFEKLYIKSEKLINKADKDIAINYLKSVESLRTDIRKVYDKYGQEDGKSYLKDISEKDKIQVFEKNISLNLAKLYKDNSGIISKTIINNFNINLDSTIKAVEKETKKSLISIHKDLSKQIDKIVNSDMKGLHWAERMGHHRNNVIYEVNKTLKGKLSQGATYKEMSDEIMTKLNGDVINPMRIVRTESQRISQITQNETLDRLAKNGMKMTKTWRTVKDERVRDQHRDMEGVTVPYEEDFILPDGTSTKSPHITGIAKHDIHCRCFMTVDFIEDEKTAVYEEKNKNLEIPEIKNEKVKKSAKNLDKILEKNGEKNLHAVEMRNYFEFTEFIEDKKLKSAFAYDDVDDIIKFNPESESFDKYDLNYALSHELAHRMDMLKYKSYENKEFLEAIEKSKKVLYDNQEKIKKWFDIDGIYEADEAVSDIISSLSKGKANNYLPAGHKPNYWKDNTVAQEIFANLSSIYVLDYDKYFDFKSTFSGLFKNYLEIIE